MLKRLSISICLLLAFALLQAHNFIPHHHKAEDHITAHGHGHDHDDDHEGNDHDSPLNDLNHSAEFGKIVVKQQDVVLAIEKPVITKSILDILNTPLKLFDQIVRHIPPDKDSPLHVIFLSHSLPLRAPPASLA